MKWLLIVLLIQLDAEGKPGQVVPAQQLYGNQQDCLEAGDLARTIVPPEILSVATCVPESSFDMKVMKPLEKQKEDKEN